MITTGSKIKAYAKCERACWLGYLAPNGTAVSGWERRALSMPLATGGYVHEGVEAMLRGADATAASQGATIAYLGAVAERGLAIDGGVAEDVRDEQVALVEALTHGFGRVVMPKLEREYDLSRALVEQELTVRLSDDVTLAARVDLAAPRRADGRWFLFNWKTTSEAGERFMRSYETDMQLVTETLALEAFLGEPVSGVNVLGIVKGQRVGVDDRMVEVRGADKKATAYIQRNKLLYGYKIDPNPPVQAGAYDWESTTRKGWYKFRVFREHQMAAGSSLSPVAYWVAWLPEEVVESHFVWVPTIWVEQDRRERKVEQIVALERRMLASQLAIEQGVSVESQFVQNEGACQQYGAHHRCGQWDQCWTGGVAEDPAGSGLYVPRQSNHPIEGE